MGKWLSAAVALIMILLGIIGWGITRETGVNDNAHKTLHTLINVQDTKLEHEQGERQKLCSRVDKLEAYTTTMKDDIGEMKSDVKDIKELLYTLAAERKRRNESER